MQKLITTGALLFACAAGVAAAAPKAKEIPLEYLAEIDGWHQKMETSLRRDNGWLTLAGRFMLKSGANTFGTGKDNDVVFPPELTGTGPDRLGTLIVDSVNRSVTLKLAEGVAMTSDGKPFSGERAMGTSPDKRDWVALGRIAMHVIARDGYFALRLADNESQVRRDFAGRIWYPPNPALVVNAKFIPYPAGRKIAIVDVIDEVSDEPCPGFVEFTLQGKKMKMDVIGDDAEGLFFVFRDATAGKTTYPASRFLFVDKKPAPNTSFKLDFNKAYNPPCAFSEFTTCPLPPKQNIYKVKIEAGEKYRKRA